MTETDQAAISALSIMQKWQWISGDPDGNTWPLWKDISEAISRLAMEGIEHPRNIMIALLQSGEMVAQGRYRWRKYQWGSTYRIEEFNSPINPRNWRILADIIEEERLEFASPGGFLLESVELKKLGEESCYPFECDFENNRFSTALCPPDLEPYDKSYFEEGFDAWDIEVRPAKLEFEFDEWEIEKAEPAVSRGGRPPAKWWPDFAEELAMFIHEEGIPGGSGHDGQSEILDKVCARLTAAGKPEPGRATVQPVINAVLARIRSAGK